MIVGHGIDVQDMAQLAKLLAKKPQFAEKVLTQAELDRFASLPEQRRLSYLAGRWAAKEAFSKAYGTGIVLGCHFQDMEILTDERGRPYFSRSPFSGRVWVSISHSGQLAQASVILEGEDHDFKPSSPNLGNH